MTIGGKQVKVSGEFASAYQELVTAVSANDTANIPARLAAAQAAAKSPEERYAVAGAQLDAAANAKDNAGIAAALEAVLATGVVAAADQPKYHLNLGKAYFNGKQYDRAAAAFQKVLQANPNDAEAQSMLARTLSAQGKGEDAVAMLQKVLAESSAGGGKAPEEVYKRAVAAAYQAKLPMAPEIARQWASAYPSPTSWSDAIGIYRNLNQVDEATTLDLLRFSRAAGVLKSEADFDRYAYRALTTGYPGEAKAVLAEGVAAGVVDANKSPFKELIAEANKKSAGEEATLAAAAKTALAAPGAKVAMNTGDLLYGYGQYAKAAELYRAALTKPGVDAHVANLHLGMALAQAGDKAGAIAALNTVRGVRVAVAKYWLAWLASRP
jgi:tetratricopeptide (TPR) repeat protein